MFNIGAGELFIIFLVAFFVVGPKDLPKVIKGIKSALQTVRSLIKDLKAQTGWDDIVKEMTDTKEEVTGTFKSLDVTRELKDAKKSVEDSVNDLNIKQDLEEAKSALEKDVSALKVSVEGAVAPIKAELDPRALTGSGKAEPSQPLAAGDAPQGKSAPAEEIKTGSDADKMEERI
jgi:sec-independent protein translocase protein TatB